MKVGTRRARPASGLSGLDGRIKVLVTEDAHFSHAAAADWLGLGVDNLVVMKPNAERRSDLQRAAEDMDRILRDGHDIGGILLNGGTTYDHAIDDIAGFVKLRNDLVQRHQLQYVPHIHVDSVVGWVWLMFRNYDFDENELGIGREALRLIEKQTRRIEGIALADSWGVDFHKGVGGCPVDCSFVLMNNKLDFERLRKGGNPVADIHQLAGDFSSYSPVDYTLETSRAGGKALAALAALHSLGLDGYRRVLARVIEATVTLRAEVAKHGDMAVINEHALGYQTMVRLFPPESVGDDRRNLELTSSDDQVAKFTVQVNRYLKEFFGWDNRTRMNVNAGGVVYSFSKKYITTPSGSDISGLKFYIVSPRTDPEHAVKAVEVIRSRKDEFDNTVWRARGIKP
jgi:L-2,4-diaminobutyrate decarboxylase